MMNLAILITSLVQILNFAILHVTAELKYWGKWFIETTGVDSFRLDAVKHISANFYKEWLDYLNETFKKISLLLQNTGVLT